MLFTFVFAVSFLSGCYFVWLGCSAFVVFMYNLIKMFNFKSKAVRVLFRNLLIVVTVIVVVTVVVIMIIIVISVIGLKWVELETTISVELGQQSGMELDLYTSP